MPAFPIYVTQDGADFYVYKDEDCTDLLMTRTYPRPVSFDLRDAEQAREWFKGLCSRNQIVHWPNPFRSVADV